MPNCLFLNTNTSQKTIKLAVLLLLSPLFFYGQSLTGLWVGALSNDSTTIRKDQSFEIALTEYRGKVYGYSRSEFIVNDTLYYIVKRVKGTITGDVCEVKDDEIIAYNFRGKIDKGIKVTSIFYRNKKDSSWYLAGTWKTNQTKRYYSVSGKVDLLEEKDLNASKIFPHLEELNVAKDVAFYKERKAEPVVMKNAESESTKLQTLIKAEQQSTISDVTVINPDTKKVEVNTVPVSNSQIIRTKTEPVKTGAISIPTQTDAVLVNAEVKEETKRQKTSIKTEEQSAIKPTFSPNKPNANNVAVNNTPMVSKPIMAIAAKPELKKTDPVTPGIKKVEPLSIPDYTAGRKSEFAQTVTFTSDSLELALYDNGEIDGDTVSVFMDGEVLLSRQGLKASAIKKTIHIIPGQNDEFTLVLFAENLGKYPPNTGLLVVHDGDEVYNIRFSADFQKNAGVVFRRKK